MGVGGGATGFPEKESSADCHLRMTESAPPHFPFFLLFLQLWALKSVLYAQMLGLALRLQVALLEAQCTRVSNLWPCPGSKQGWGREAVGRKSPGVSCKESEPREGL